MFADGSFVHDSVVIFAIAFIIRFGETRISQLSREISLRNEKFLAEKSGSADPIPQDHD